MTDNGKTQKMSPHTAKTTTEHNSNDQTLQSNGRSGGTTSQHDDKTTGNKASRTYTFPFQPFESSSEAKQEAEQLRNKKDNFRLGEFPSSCGNGPFSSQLQSARCADVMRTMCAEPTIQGRVQSQGNRAIYRSPFLDEQSACRGWATLVRSAVDINQSTGGYWGYNPSQWNSYTKEIHNNPKKKLSPEELSYVYDSTVHYTCLKSSKGKKQSECECLYFVDRASNWCTTQKNQCNSYGTDHVQQTCAMKAFSDSHEAIEFQKCAPYYCWYKPCFHPLSESLVPLAVAYAQQSCPGICIQKQTSNRVCIHNLPSTHPINGQVTNKLNADMIKSCGNNAIIPNKLEMLTFSTSLPINGLLQFPFSAGNMGNRTFMIYSVTVYCKKHPQCHPAIRPGKGVIGPKQTTTFRVFLPSHYWHTLNVGDVVDCHIKFTYNPGIPNHSRQLRNLNDATDRIETTRCIPVRVSEPIGSETRTEKGLTQKDLIWIIVAAIVLWISLFLFSRALRSPTKPETNKQQQQRQQQQAQQSQ